MTTTIQIDIKTKKRLFRVITELQQKSGRRVSYSEAIDYLLQRENEPDEVTDYSSLYELRGLLKKGEGKKLLKEMRDKEHEREQKLLGN